MRAKQKNKKFSLGFTLLEVLVVTGILVLATGLLLVNFNFFQRQSSLDMSAQEIVSALRLAQNKALASEGASSFGVYFETNGYTVFKGKTFYPTSPDNSVYRLNSTLVITDVSLEGGGNAVAFEQLTGATDNFGSLKVSLANDSTKSKTIFIDSSGVIALSSSLPSDEGRKKDSRHVEFTYGHDAQNASALTIYFPTAGQTENIDYQNYLNDSKTIFSWEGTVTVLGQEQRLKIHTHSLTPTNALFCVHRDRRYNTQALNIFLDGQNLLNYYASGTTTRGTSIWAGEPINQ